VDEPKHPTRRDFVSRMNASAAATHTGLVRSQNEDSYVSDPALGLWLVADGVGGHADGEVAAAVVCHTVRSEFARGCDLVEAIRRAHLAVLEEIDQRGGEGNMGSTVVALATRDGQGEIAWVGDSRAYLYDGELTPLTRDHSYVADLLERGFLTPEQVPDHPGRHMLSQSLGVGTSGNVNPERVHLVLRPGQQVLLCSDGLTDELDEQAIVDTLRDGGSAGDQVQALVDGALSSGGRDNVTVVLVSATPEQDDAPGGSAPDTSGTGHTGSGLTGSGSLAMWLLPASLALLGALWLLS
jgi:protein phosphatase